MATRSSPDDRAPIATASDTGRPPLGGGEPSQARGRALSVAGIGKSFGDAVVLDGVSLEVGDGELLALLGPSGCGKTTLLRVIAGLERPDAGRVSVGARPMVDHETFVSADKRGIGLVLQDGALFPHLDVGANVAYGVHSLAKAERRSRVAQALAMVGLAGLEERSPSTLSGGQQQRVALARALAPRPAVLLLDEPFSNLDAALRAQLRTELRALLAQLGVTTVFVTHDQEEAFVQGDRVAVLRDGGIVQVAAPDELYRRPVDPWVARFVGAANLLPAHAAGRGADTAFGPVPLDDETTGQVDVLVRPEWIDLAPLAAGASQARSSGGASATVVLVEYRGADTAYVIELDAVGSAPVASLGSTEDSVVARLGARVVVVGTPELRRGDRVVARYAGPPTVAFPTP